MLNHFAISIGAIVFITSGCGKKSSSSVKDSDSESSYQVPQEESISESASSSDGSEASPLNSSSKENSAIQWCRFGPTLFGSYECKRPYYKSKQECDDAKTFNDTCISVPTGQ